MATQKTKIEPWGEAEGELRKIFAESTKTYNNQLAQGPFQGAFYSGLTGDQQAGMNMVRNFANGAGGELGALLTNTAKANAGAGANFGANANALYNRFSVDPTQQITQNAGAFINNDILNGQIDAANRDVARLLTEQQLPGLNRAAAGSGNMNSSRAGVAEAIMARDAQDRMADTAAAMRGQAYNQAIGQASQNYFQGADAAMAANNQVGQALTAGQTAANNALSYNNAVAQGLIGAGQMQQADQQAQLDAARQQYEYQQNYPWNLHDRFTNVVTMGSGNFQTQTAGAGGGGSPLAKGLGGAASGAAMGSMFGPWGTAIGAGLGGLAGLFGS